MTGREPLQSLLSSLQRRETVDWEAIENALSKPEDRKLFEQLKELANSSEVLGASTSAMTKSRSEEADPPLPTDSWAHLNILEPLGHGAFGVVFRALETRLNTEVALKLLPMSQLQDPLSDHRTPFEEAQMLARIRHPNVLAVYGVEIHAGWLGMWTQLIRGCHLDELLENTGVMGPIEARAIGSEICSALAALHNEGLVHGDIKCQNVMRDSGGRVVLMDFGLVREQLGVETSREHSSIGGTPLYMAPEILLGAPPTVQSDIYALSVLLFRLVTRSFPVAASSFQELLVLHARRGAQRLLDVRADLPAEFVRVVEKGLSPNPADRFETVGELDAALAGVAGFTPNLETRATRTNNLPTIVSSFVGRDEEQDALRKLLQERRLVTITGSGGSGKTRLALRLAEEALVDGEVWFVNLAKASGSEHVPTIAATAFGVKESRGRTALETLRDHFAGRTCLFVLDNCEHVIEGAAAFAGDLLGLDVGMKILATSRQPLGIGGEQTFPLNPLGLPLPDASTDQILSSDGVRLFAERAVLAFPSFQPDERNASTIARICRRLDGIPLALELAAARVGSLSLDQIEKRLNDRFRLLASPGILDQPHHRTLRMMIDWSHDLLSEPEKQLFRRLAAFRDGWMLDAAEKVCGFGELKEEEILDLHFALARQSLIEVERDPSEPEIRYRMLESIGQFAREQLEASTDRKEASAMHHRHFVAWAGTIFRERNDREWLKTLSREEGNLRSAQDGLLEVGDLEGVGELTLILSGVWYRKGHLAKGLQICRRVLSSAAWTPDSLPRAKVSNAVGALAWGCGDYPLAKQCFEQARDLAARHDDTDMLIVALRGLGSVAFSLGDRPKARETWLRCLELAREADLDEHVATSLNNLANVYYTLGELEEAEGRARESVATWRRLGDDSGILSALNTLALTLLRRGNSEEAEKLFLEITQTSRSLGHRQSEAIGINNLGMIAFRQGRLVEAESHFEDSFELRKAINDRAGAAIAVRNLGIVLAEQGHLDAAKSRQLESLEISRSLSDSEGEAHTISNLASLALKSGNLQEAESLSRRTARLMFQLANLSGMLDALEIMADVYIDSQKLEEAARIVSAAEVKRQSMGIQPDESKSADIERRLDQLRTRLDPATFQRCLAEGRASDFDEIVAQLSDPEGGKPNETP